MREVVEDLVKMVGSSQTIATSRGPVVREVTERQVLSSKPVRNKPRPGRELEHGSGKRALVKSDDIIPMDDDFKDF